MRGRSRRPDEDLVRLAQSPKDPEAARAAAAELLGRYQRAVYLWCFRYVREHEGALDLTQDVLLSAYRKLSSFGGRGKFSSWLFSIARNRCLNEMRQAVPLARDDSVLDRVQDGDVDPLRRLEEREDEERMLRLMRTALDPLEQRAIWLRCFERLGVDQITNLLGLESASGGRVILQRARRKLRSVLAGESAAADD